MRDLVVVIDSLACSGGPAEVFAPAEEFVQAVSIQIRPCGIAVGVVADDAPVGSVQRYKMCAQLPVLAPPVKEDAHVASVHQRIKIRPAGGQLHREALLTEKQRRAPDAGAQIAMHQRELPFVIADELLRLCPVAHQTQGVVGGDPSTAGSRGGTEAIAVPLFRNLMLIVDQIGHIIR